MNQQILDNLDMGNDLDSQELLICELGDQRRYAIPLVLVSRLEDFDRHKVEWSGDQPLVKYGDIPMPLIDLEKSLNLRGESALHDPNKITTRLISCVVIKVRNHLFGLIVHDIIDIQQTNSAIHSDSVDRLGLLGTVFLKNSTITILDIHAIIQELNVGRVHFQPKSKVKIGKVLIVDDSPLYQKILKDSLEEEGYEVLTAANGQIALDLLNDNIEVNLIITDIDMPVMDGWSLTESIRKSDKSFNRIPVIGVSGRVTQNEKERGMKCGFNDQLEKTNKSGLQKAILEYI